jgi:hypothetical protein
MNSCHLMLATADVVRERRLVCADLLVVCPFREGLTAAARMLCQQVLAGCSHSNDRHAIDVLALFCAISEAESSFSTTGFSTIA